nr:hypothetical protein [Bacteroidota bacterium]
MDKNQKGAANNKVATHANDEKGKGMPAQKSPNQMSSNNETDDKKGGVKPEVDKKSNSAHSK